jgi:hypothetical protein
MKVVSILESSTSSAIQSPEHQLKLRELRKSIESKYQLEMESAGVLQRWKLKRKIEAEFRMERKKIEPSDMAL